MPGSLAALGMSENFGSLANSSFVVYMLSYNTPLAKILAPTRKDLRQVFRRGVL